MNIGNISRVLINNINNNNIIYNSLHLPSSLYFNLCSSAFLKDVSHIYFRIVTSLYVIIVVKKRT